MRTYASKSGEYYYLNGKKSMITNAAVAQFYCVFASTDPSLRTRGISAFYLEKDYPGVIVGKSEEKMGMIGTDLSELIFDNVRLTKDNLIGRGRPGLGPCHGHPQPLAARGRRAGGRHRPGRARFRRRIRMEQGAVWPEAGRLRGHPVHGGGHGNSVEAARALVYDAAHLLDMKIYERDKMSAIGVDKLSAMAKVYSADVAMKVTTDAVQILGGYGYTKEYPVERMMRDAKATQIYEGTNQVQRIVIARDIFRKYMPSHLTRRLAFQLAHFTLHARGPEGILMQSAKSPSARTGAYYCT